MRVYVAPNVFEALKRALPEGSQARPILGQTLAVFGGLSWVNAHANAFPHVQLFVSAFVASGSWVSRDLKDSGIFPLLVDRDPATMTDAELRAALGLKGEE